ncbi:MAG TPA: PadR family transcriptional regulator [Vicinamibacterales bacterium]|nr:PadR family transcriptional regulator [Vicinamibacterales bacterium]
MQSPLGEFEVMVLLAVLHLADAAYPPSVRSEIERRARRKVARGAIYVTLDRLESKGLLSSASADEHTPGARPRRTYRATQRGLRALRRAMAAVERMKAGLEPVLNQS